MELDRDLIAVRGMEALSNEKRIEIQERRWGYSGNDRGARRGPPISPRRHNQAAHPPLPASACLGIFTGAHMRGIGALCAVAS